MRYVYCPLCGTKLTGKAAGDDGMVPFCDLCGKYWFDTFSSEVNQAEWVPYKEAPARMFPKRPGNSQNPIYEQYKSQIEGITS